MAPPPAAPLKHQQSDGLEPLLSGSTGLQVWGPENLAPLSSLPLIDATIY